MKLVKGILFFCLIMIGAGLMAALFAPSTQVVKRTIKIQAPQDVVFRQLSNFRMWPKWDPWFAKDTSQIRTYNGTVGQEKYGYSWSSKNSDVGKGRIEVTQINKYEQLDFVFFMNNENNDQGNKGYFKLEEYNGMTEIEWGLVSEMSYPSKALNYFIDGMVGPDFEQGLTNLKSLIESPSFSDEREDKQGVHIAEEYGVNYALIKKNDLPMNQMEIFFKNGYKEIYTYMQTNGLAPTGEARGLFYKWDEENSVATLAAAVPISKIDQSYGSPVNLGLGECSLQNGAVSCKINGPYSQSYNAHLALGKWVDSTYKVLESPVVEEYIVGPRQTEDTSQFVTRIIYHFKQ